VYTSLPIWWLWPSHSNWSDFLRISIDICRCSLAGKKRRNLRGLYYELPMLGHCC
jgi:hypothetical protein